MIIQRFRDHRIHVNLHVLVLPRDILLDDHKPCECRTQILLGGVQLGRQVEHLSFHLFDPALRLGADPLRLLLSPDAHPLDAAHDAQAKV